GIRDKLVTGVQTCALPISVRKGQHVTRWNRPVALRVAGAVRGKRPRRLAVKATPETDDFLVAGVVHRQAERALHRLGAAGVELRSEERRVGKECRSRGSQE